MNTAILTELQKELADMQEQLAKMLDLIDDLDKKVASIPNAVNPLTPIGPGTMSPYDKIVDRYPTLPTTPFLGEKRKCPKCGIALEGVMGYICSNLDCPTGLGTPVC